MDTHDKGRTCSTDRAASRSEALHAKEKSNRPDEEVFRRAEETLARVRVTLDRMRAHLRHALDEPRDSPAKRPPPG